MQKFEYASVPLIPHAVAEILNNWGDDGWELVQVYQPGDVPGTVGYRPSGGTTVPARGRLLPFGAGGTVSLGKGAKRRSPMTTPCAPRII